MLGDSGDLIRQAAADFSAAVAAGRVVRIEGGSVPQHLSMLHELVATQPIAVCKRYASLPGIPWGRFSSLDALRMLILRAPDSTPGDIGDLPMRRTEENYISLVAPGAITMLFVFAGAAHQFGGPLRVLHQWFRQLGVSIVYLFDMDWTYYLGGIKGLSGSIEGTTDAMKEIARDAGATSLRCLGNSGGGFGAILYAAHLAASRTLAFSPPTAIRESLEAVTRKIPQAREMETGSGAIELRTLYEQSKIGGEYRVYYPEQNEHDKSEALNLANLPRLDLRPLPGVRNHNLIPHFISTGQFERELNWVVEGCPPP